MQSLQSASDITSSMQSLGASFYMSRKGGIGIGGGGWVHLKGANSMVSELGCRSRLSLLLSECVRVGGPFLQPCSHLQY